MLCQECKQRQATVHWTKIINDHKTELHLCEECARQHENFLNITPFSVNDLIASFMDFGNKSSYIKQSNFKCDVCGLDYNQFKKTGMVGCQECYKYFRDELIPVLSRIQGSTQHNGKVPRRSGTGLSKKRQLEELKAQLKKAVESEAYERAAEIRDMIKALEQEGN